MLQVTLSDLWSPTTVGVGHFLWEECACVLPTCGWKVICYSEVNWCRSASLHPYHCHWQHESDDLWWPHPEHILTLQDVVREVKTWLYSGMYHVKVRERLEGPSTIHNRQRDGQSINLSVGITEWSWIFLPEKLLWCSFFSHCMSCWSGFCVKFEDPQFFLSRRVCGLWWLSPQDPSV